MWCRPNGPDTDHKAVLTRGRGFGKSRYLKLANLKSQNLGDIRSMIVVSGGKASRATASSFEDNLANWTCKRRRGRSMTRNVLDKMGFRAGMRTEVWRMPPELSTIFATALATAGKPANWRVAFAENALTIKDIAKEFAFAYQSGETLWICYPKKSGSIITDISRDNGWEAINELDLLPVSQIAVDKTWSALRFRLRSEIPKLTRLT